MARARTSPEVVLVTGKHKNAIRFTKDRLVFRLVFRMVARSPKRLTTKRSRRPA